MHDIHSYEYELFLSTFTNSTNSLIVESLSKAKCQLKEKSQVGFLQCRKIHNARKTWGTRTCMRMELLDGSK